MKKGHEDRSGNRPGAGKPPADGITYASIADRPYNCICSSVVLPDGKSIYIKYMNTMCTARH